MKLFSKAKDFISPNEELKETLESSVKELLDGRIWQIKSFVGILLLFFS